MKIMTRSSSPHHSLIVLNQRGIKLGVVKGYNANEVEVFTSYTSTQAAPIITRANLKRLKIADHDLVTFKRVDYIMTNG